MEKKLKAGIIGAGMIGKSHIRGYRNMPEEVEIFAVTDIREDEAKRVAKENNIPYVFTDYKEMLKIAEIDIVDVCLPNNLHCSVTIDTLNAGKHVYCEKPMAMNRQEAHKMLETSKKLGKKLAIQMGYLFAPSSRAAKRIIEAGLLGRIYYAKASHYQRKGRSFVDGYGTPIFSEKKYSGGGALIDWGAYNLSLMMWLLGNPEVERVTASTFQEIPMDERRRKEGHYDVEEAITGFICLAGNITLFMEEAWAIHTDKGEGNRLFGSKGGLYLNPIMDPEELHYFTDICGMEADTTFHTQAYYQRQSQLDKLSLGYSSSQVHFVWAVLERVSMIDTAAIGMRVVEISDAMYESAQIHEEVILTANNRKIFS